MWKLVPEIKNFFTRSTERVNIVICEVFSVLEHFYFQMDVCEIGCFLINKKKSKKKRCN